MAEQKTPPSEADLTARLVVEGALRMIRGDVKGQVGIEPVVLTAEERLKFGLHRGGPTLFYPAGEEGVFFDLMGDNINVWFRGGDCPRATETLHKMLMRDFPDAKQLDDVAFSEDKRMHARVYRVELGNGRLAAIQTAFTRDPTTKKFTFAVRLISQQRPG